MQDSTPSRVENANPADDYVKENGHRAFATACKNGEFPSLSTQRIRDRIEMGKVRELSAFGPHDVAEIAVIKMKNGKPEMDAEGFPVLITKKVLRRTLVEQKYQAKLDKLGL